MTGKNKRKSQKRPFSELRQPFSKSLRHSTRCVCPLLSLYFFKKMSNSEINMEDPIVGLWMWFFEKTPSTPRSKICKNTSPIALTRSARKTYPSAFQNIKFFYQSPSSRRDILILVWAIFENFRKSPDFRHTFPRFWTRNCPDNRKFLENVLKSKWNFWSYVEGFNAIVLIFCIHKVNTFFVGQKILFFRFFDFLIFFSWFLARPLQKIDQNHRF